MRSFFSNFVFFGVAFFSFFCVILLSNIFCNIMRSFFQFCFSLVLPFFLFFSFLLCDSPF